MDYHYECWIELNWFLVLGSVSCYLLFPYTKKKASKSKQLNCISYYSLFIIYIQKKASFTSQSNIETLTDSSLTRALKVTLGMTSFSVKLIFKVDILDLVSGDNTENAQD